MAEETVPSRSDRSDGAPNVLIPMFKWVVSGLLSLILTLMWLDRQQIVHRIELLENQSSELTAIKVQLATVSANQQYTMGQLDRIEMLARQK